MHMHTYIREREKGAKEMIAYRGTHNHASREATKQMRPLPDKTIVVHRRPNLSLASQRANNAHVYVRLYDIRYIHSRLVDISLSARSTGMLFAL